MNISIENTSTLGRRLTVSLPNVKVVEEFETRFNKLQHTAHIKGFRKGKVPPKILKERYGLALRGEAIEALINECLSNAIRDKNLTIAGRASIETVVDSPEKEFEFVASFEVYPHIELADLSSVEFEKTIVDITDQDIENMITQLQDRFCNWEVVDRKSELTDKLTMDLGYTFDGDTSKNKPNMRENVILILGAERVVPGLSEALVGKPVEEEIKISLTYPEEWEDSHFAGKKVHMTAKIHKIEAKKPISKEELMKIFMLEEGDEAGLKTMLREKMQLEVTEKVYAGIKEKVLEILIDKNPVELPRALVQQELAALNHEIDHKVHQNIEPGEASEAELEDMAQKRVLLGLLVREYVQKKNLRIHADQVKKEIIKIARSYPYVDPEEVMKAYLADKRLLESVERMVLLDEAVNAMLSEMKVKEVKQSFDEVMKPAK